MRALTWLLATGLMVACGDPEGLDPLECSDLGDNDGDSLIDCLDPDCVARGYCDNREGVNASECVDGLDNDDDGYFDCNDFDCFAAPLCQENDEGILVIPGAGGGGGDGGTTTPDPGPSGPGPFIHDPLASATVSLRIAFDMDEFGDSLCAFSQVCDCFLQLGGEGTYMEGADNRGTFEGTWALTDTDCSDISGLANAVWWTTDTAHHTFRWSADGGQVDEWIAHQYPGDIDPFQSNIADQGQFWISGMRANYPGVGNQLTHQEVKVDLADLIYITTTFDFQVTFQ